MHSGIAGIDHIIVGARDLDRARAAWSRLGFALSPRGRHIGQGTANYCIMFPRDYIELLGIVDPNDPGQRLGAFLTQREGPMAAALAPSAPIEEVRSRLLGLGLHPSEPRTLGRELELAAGAVTLRFSLLSLPPDETPGLDCFICAHLTPELLRQPEWLDHANGAAGLKGLCVVVESTTALLRAYDRLFGILQVTTTDAVATVHVGRHRIVLSTPDDFMTMHPGVGLDPAFPLPGIAALEFAVDRRERSADWLARQRVPFGELPDRTLVVPAAEANGAILFFSEG
jgi:hypothetical protein